MIFKTIPLNMIFIIIDIIIGSIMAFLGILTYGKTKKITYLFFVLTGLCMYIQMAFRILAEFNIIILNEYQINGTAIYQYIVNDLPYIFIIIGFILLIKEK